MNKTKDHIYFKGMLEEEEVITLLPDFHATNYTPFLGVDKKSATVAKPANRRGSFVEVSTFNYRIMGTFTEIYLNGLWGYHHGCFRKYEFTKE